MLRIAVIFSLVLGACDFGESPGAGGADASGSGSGSDCENVAAAPFAAGHHNPGMGCRSTAACHNAALGLGTGAPEYSVAGTVYKDTAGTMPYPGATVLVTMGGTTKKFVTADNGNFWFVPALQPAPTAAMTAMTSASACPTTKPMSGLLVNGGGDCNSGACHAVGAQGPIYVNP